MAVVDLISYWVFGQFKANRALKDRFGLMGEVAIEENEAALADFLLLRGFSRLYFGGGLEARYKAQLPSIALVRHRWLLLCGLLLVGGFGFMDPVLAPDVVGAAWAIRYGVLTPILLMQLFFSFQSFYLKIETFFSTLSICAIAGALLFIMKSSDSPLVNHYHGLLLLIVLYGNMMTRTRFWHSLVWSMVVLVAYYLNFAVIAVNDPIVGYYSTLIAVVCLVGLLASYQVEYQARHDFLQNILLYSEKNRLERVHKELYRVAVVDSLTGLYNRRHFDESLALSWRHAYAERMPISLLFIDVDCFKRFNDTYGHQRGDQCLKVVADTLQTAERRPSDIIARYGGEEFVIILPGMGELKARKFAETIREAVERLRIPHRASTVADHVTVSVGISTVIPGPKSNSKMLVEQADRALYQAKEQGRNRVCQAKVSQLELVASP